MSNIPDIVGILKDSRYEDSGKVIDFSLSESVLRTDERGIDIDIYTAIVKVMDKNTGGLLRFPMDLVKIPVATPTGYKVNGTYKQVVASYVLSQGYYLNEADKNMGRYLSCRSKGFDVKVYVNNNELMIAGNSSKSKLPLAVFLKAITKKTYGELALMLGPENLHVMLSFDSAKELHYVECVKKVLTTIFNTKAGRDEVVKNSSVQELEAQLRDRLFNVRYVDLGGSCLPRLSTTISFKERCRGLILEEDININGYSYSRGQSLFTKHLEELDLLPITSLRVSSLDKKFYTIRKTYSNDFRVLGRTLAQGISAGDLVIPAGTELTVSLIYKIQSTMIRTLVLDGPTKGSVEYVTRTPSRRNFSTEDFISVLQSYMDFYNGISNPHQTSSLSNQNMIDMSYLAVDVIKQNCEAVVQAVTSPVEEEEDDDLLIRAIDKLRVSTDELVNYLLDAKTKESQTAEINNTIQKRSKDVRVSKSTKRATGSMSEIASDQQAFLDGFDTPESSKVGLTQARTLLSRINNDGMAEAPFTVVENGKPTDLVIYLSADQYKGSPIAEWNETFTYVNEQGEVKPKKYVQCFMDGEMVTANIEDIKYMYYGPYSIMSPAHACIFGSEHEAAKRITMGSNHIKSSHILMKGEPPRVSSGGSSLIRDGIYSVQRILEESRGIYDLLQKIPEDKLKNLKLKLTDKSIDADGMVLRFTVIGLTGQSFMIEYKVVYGVKSGTGGLYSSRIKYKPSMTYSWDDVVVTTTDYFSFEDLDQLHLMVDTGTMKVDQKIFKESLAMGTNLLVAVKTNESCTIDDSVTISRRLIGDDTLSSFIIEQVDYELKSPKREKKDNREEIETFSQLSWVNSVLPPNDSIISPGGEVIRVARTSRDVLTGSDKTQDFISITYDGLEESQVLNAKIVGNKAIVLLARINSIEQGDKLSGSHGDKSVVAKILEESEMPYDEETGEVIQMFINPLSLPSRMNVAIVVEGTLGRAARAMGKNFVITPFKGGVFEETVRLQDEYDIHPRQLINGKTGLPYDRPVSVLQIYYYKSEHAVDKKIKYAGDDVPREPKFNQPSKGTGTQASGEYELWVYGSQQSDEMIQSLYSVGSTDTKGYLKRKDKIKKGEALPPVKGINNNDLYSQMLLRVMGLDPHLDDKGNFGFPPLTDAKIRSMNVFPIPPGAMDKLRAPEIFGNPKVLGAKSQWGWFDLGTEIINPAILLYAEFEKFIRAKKVILEDTEAKLRIKVVDDVNPTKNQLYSLIYSEHATSSVLYVLEGMNYIIKSSDLKKYNDLIKAGKFVQDDELKVLQEQGQMYIGMQAVVELFRSAKPLETLEVHKRSNIKEDALLKLTYNILSFEESGYKLSDFIISSYPVIPISFRPESKQRGVQQEYDYYYKRIMEAANKCIRNSAYNPESTRELVDRINDFIGINFPRYPYDEKVREKFKPIKTFFTTANEDKKGAFREKVLKTRVMNSGRTPIIPNNDLTRTPKELGIPFIMATTIWRTQLVAMLSRKFEDNFQLTEQQWNGILEVIGVSDTAFKRKYNFAGVALTGVTVEEFYELVYGAIKTYVEGINRFGPEEGFEEFCVITSGRQPTLHKFSIGGYRPYLTNHKCIEIHPLVCPAYNADFDGDQMWVMGWFSEAEKRQVLEKYSPENSTLNPKDGSIVLKPSQDIVLGIYYLTMLKDNSNDFSHEYYKDASLRHYSSLEALESDLQLRYVMPYDPVAFNHKGNVYLATAGRFLVNGIIPEFGGFTDSPYEDHSQFPASDSLKARAKALRFDGLTANAKGKVSARAIKVAKLTDMVKFVINNYDKKLYFSYIQKISEIGFFYSDRSGITIGMDDFKQREETKRIIALADRIAIDLDSRYRLGLLSETERKNERIALYTKAKELIMIDYLTNIDHNGNIFIMFESGARGDEGQITQAAAMVGVLQKNGNETLEYPVRSSFIKGLSSFEMLLTLYSARQAIRATQLETANAGEVTRKSVYILEGVKIVEEDCGVGYTKTPLEFGEFQNRIVRVAEPKISLEVDMLLGKELNGPELPLKLLKNFLEDGKLTTKCISLLIKNRVQTVVVGGEEFKFMYDLSPLFRSLYYYRNAKGLDHLLKGAYISDATLNTIAEEQPSHIEVRDMFRCRSVGGVCQKCYGAQYDTLEEPPLGLGVPIISGQSIGEPSTQLTMNTHNRGGAAGASINDGVKFVGGILGSGKVLGSKYDGPPVAPVDGYIDIGEDGKYVLVPSDDEQIALPNWKSHFSQFKDMYKFHNSSSLNVGVGEFIRRGQILSDDLPQTLTGLSHDDGDIIHQNQINLLRVLYDVYASSGLDVYARHFEILVRAMTSFVTVKTSDDPNFKVGQVVDRMEVLKSIAEGNAVTYSNKVMGALETTMRFAGPVTSLVLADIEKTLSHVVTSQVKMPINSVIGKVALGQPVNQDVVKPLHEIKVYSTKEEEVIAPVQEVDFVDVLTVKLEEDKSSSNEIELGDLDSMLSRMLGEDVASDAPEELEELPHEPEKLPVDEDNKLEREFKGNAKSNVF